MNFLNKITGKDDKKDDQQQGAGAGAVSAAEMAARAAMAKVFNPEWTTRMGQCDPPATGEHWAASFFCFHCVMAIAKGRADGTHACYNTMCWQPIAAAAYLRKTYHIKGTCGDDMGLGIFCMCCNVRRSVTESHERGLAPQLQGGPDAWQTTFFGCGCCEFLKAVICPFCVAHNAKARLMPAVEADPWFDYLCTVPFAVYGQVRHSYGIKQEFGICDDLLIPVVCYPCALAQADRETMLRLSTMPQIYAAQGVGAAGTAVAGKWGAMQ